jgi:hypothetical protein
MRVLWNNWRAEIDALPALAEEWTEELAEEFVQDLRSLFAAKRAESDSALKLAHAIKYVHVLHEDLLVFFGIEDDFLRWSIMNCPSSEVDDARLVLAEWREVLQKYSGTFPPSVETFRSYAALQVSACEAQRAAKMILAGFQALDAYLAPRAVKPKELEEAATGTMLMGKVA